MLALHSLLSSNLPWPKGPGVQWHVWWTRWQNRLNCQDGEGESLSYEWTAAARSSQCAGLVCPLANIYLQLCFLEVAHDLLVTKARSFSSGPIFQLTSPSVLSAHPS